MGTLIEAKGKFSRPSQPMTRPDLDTRLTPRVEPRLEDIPGADGMSPHDLMTALRRLGYEGGKGPERIIPFHQK